MADAERGEDTARYVYIYEYVVDERNIERFLEYYRPGGAWVQLFSKGEGYIDTELLRDRERPERFVTVDTWVSQEAFDAFRASRAKAWDALDRTCADFTGAETPVGTFAPT